MRKLVLIFIIFLLSNSILFATDNKNKEIQCKNRNADACFSLAMFYNSSNKNKEKYFLEKSCKLGHIGGCFLTGRLYLATSKNNEQNLNKAKKYFEIVCNKGFGDGCVGLGVIYEKLGRLYEMNKYLKKGCSMQLRENMSINTCKKFYSLNNK